MRAVSLPIELVPAFLRDDFCKKRVIVREISRSKQWKPEFQWKTIKIRMRQRLATRLKDRCQSRPIRLSASAPHSHNDRKDIL